MSVQEIVRLPQAFHEPRGRNAPRELSNLRDSAAFLKRANNGMFDKRYEFMRLRRVGRRISRPSREGAL